MSKIPNNLSKRAFGNVAEVAKKLDKEAKKKTVIKTKTKIDTKK